MNRNLNIFTGLCFGVLSCLSTSTVTQANGYNPYGQYLDHGIVPWQIFDGIVFMMPVPKGFEHKFSAPKNILHEYGLKEEKIETWSKLVTYTVAAKKIPNDGIKMMSNAITSGFKKSCDLFEFEQKPAIKKQGYKTQLFLIKCGIKSSDPTYSISQETLHFRIIDNDKLLLTQQFSIKQKAEKYLSPLSKQNANKVDDFFDVEPYFCNLKGKFNLAVCDKSTLQLYLQKPDN